MIANKKMSQKIYREKKKTQKGKLVAEDLIFVLFHLPRLHFCPSRPTCAPTACSLQWLTLKTTTPSLDPSAVKNPTSELLIRLLAPQCPPLSDVV